MGEASNVCSIGADKSDSKINFKIDTRSNGMVGRTIQTVKRTIKKCWIMNEDVHLALLIEITL